jgi:hypothetical protein
MTLRKAFNAWAIAMTLVAAVAASSAFADVTRQCNAQWRFMPQNDSMTYVSYAFSARRTAALPNQARRDARATILACARDAWDNRDADMRPDSCTSRFDHELVDYPFDALARDVTDALCAANPEQDHMLISVELTITGDTGCVASGDSDRFTIASNVAIDCRAPIGDGGGWECVGEECDGDEAEVPIGDGGDWDCVGPGCEGDATGTEDDAPPATATYVPLPMVRLPGNDLYMIELDAPNWMLCRQACTEDDRCGAWTYRAPTAASGPLCLIKSRAGIPVPDACCRSGIRQ